MNHFEILCHFQIPPQFQGFLIHHVENPDEEDWKGYFYAVSIFLVNLASTILNNQHFYYVVLCGNSVFTSLVCAVYDKSLKLSPTSRKERTGKIYTVLSSFFTASIADYAPQCCCCCCCCCCIYESTPFSHYVNVSM